MAEGETLSLIIFTLFTIPITNISNKTRACRNTDFWADDTSGTNIPSAEVWTK